MAYARRTDRNQSEVIEALRATGWFVCDTSRIGHGFFDVIAAKHGRIVFIEIKDGAKVKSKQQLTPAEVAMHEDFLTAGADVVILRSVEEAIQL
jgi:hypothetical protein